MYPDTSLERKNGEVKNVVSGGFELGSEERGYWSEERKLIRDTARSFAIAEVLPVANRLDPERENFSKPDRQNGRPRFWHYYP